MQKKLFYSPLFWGGLFTLVAAVFSTGFHQFDEHFQVVEFAHVKWANLAPDGLAWEYKAQIRSWTLPLIFYWIKKYISHDPFISSFLFRLLSGVVGLLASWCLVYYSKQRFKNQTAILVTLWSAYLLWFMPYIHVRGSSENWGANLFILGLFCLGSFSVDKKRLGRLILGGALLALSFQARFQMGVMILFTFLWSLFYFRYCFMHYIAMGVGFISATLVAVGIDYWGYGELVFPAINYLKFNLIDGQVNSFGISPWYEYFRQSFNRGIPPLSIVLMLSTFAIFVKRPKDFLTWAALPFLVVHCLIGHKELRFIFPIIVLTPLFLGMAIEIFPQIQMWWQKKLAQRAIRAMIALNCLTLVVASIKPANSAISFYRYLTDHQEQIDHFYSIDGHPLKMVSLELSHYYPPHLQVDTTHTMNDLASLRESFIVFTRRMSQLIELKKRFNCETFYQGIPTWSQAINIGGWVERSKAWALSQCTP